MSTSPVNSGSSTLPATGGPAAPRAPKQTLDANDFMKLLSVQLQHQDPMKPMDNNEQMAQVAQMGSMQSIAQMALSVANMNAGQSLALANSYLGREVSLLDADGSPVAGQVTAIDNQGSAPQVMVAGTYFPLAAITRIELPGASAAHPIA